MRLISVLFITITLISCTPKQVKVEYEVALDRIIFCDQYTLVKIYQERGGDIPVHLSFDGKVVYSQLLGFYCRDIRTAYILYLPNSPIMMQRIMGHELFRAIGFHNTDFKGNIIIDDLRERAK